MPAPINISNKRKVIQQWISGEARDKIAADNNIGEGTVSGIVRDYKIGLDAAEFDSARELALQARKQGLNLSDLASNFRLHNFIRNSGVSENEIESFVTNVSTGDASPEKIIALVNQLYDVSKSESIPLDHVSGYIREKLEEKQKIDEQIKEADNVPQSKNVSIEAINEHLQLNEKLKEHGLSIQDIDKLLNILSNAKRYGFGGKEIADKLYNIQELEWKEKQLKDKCKKLSKRISKYKDVVPLTEDIAAWGIGIDELLALKVGINQAAKHYNLPPLAATLQLIDDIKKYNKINGLREELSALYLQKYTLDQACSRQSQSLIALAKLKSYGLTEDRILQLNNFLEDNAFKASSYTSTK
jgi:DNA-binding transcriptional MerR regulator